VPEPVAPETELLVCFAPPVEPPSPRVILLSFMSPSDEVRLDAGWRGRMVLGRAVTIEVRDEARRAYIDVIVRIGATPLGGRTLREILRGPNGWSRWWFLKTSEKDCEWDGDIFTTVIRLTVIRRVAARYGVARIRLHGAPATVARLLGSGRERTWLARLRWGATLARALVLGSLARAALGAFYLRLWWAFRRSGTRSLDRADVALQGQWGWSVRLTPTGELHDRYFTDLPARLTAQGLTVAWLASCEALSATDQRREPVARLVAAACRHARVVLPEQFLGLRDIVRAVFDFRPLRDFVEVQARPEFRALLRLEPFDLFPILREQMAVLLAGPSVGRWELIALATARACRRLRPKVLLGFLEVLLHSRAMYAGARSAGTGTQIWAAQHAAYGRDKTFGILDPRRELRGEPDGCPLPAPDGIFVMGQLSREIWVENGFPPDHVLVTGGLRYQHIAQIQHHDGTRQPGALRILLAGSLVEASDLDMCDAVTAAADLPPGTEIALRDHPANRLSAARDFQRFRDRIRVTAGPLYEDLAWADLVVVTHSSVGEEALLRGIPVWHWVWAGVNQSVFMDLPVIPRFTSVESLRLALEAFRRDPDAYRPAAEVSESIRQQCFGGDPGNASARIAACVRELVEGRCLVSLPEPQAGEALR
jgi:surface carbohydrate biosynthesis protein (TIGR04326 family)